MKLLQTAGIAAAVAMIAGCSASTPTETNSNAVYVGTYSGSGTILFNVQAAATPAPPANVEIMLSQVASTISGRLTTQLVSQPSTTTSGSVDGHVTRTGADLEYVQTACGGKATGSFMVSGGALSGTLTGTGCDPVTGVNEPVTITFVGLVRP